MSIGQFNPVHFQVPDYVNPLSEALNSGMNFMNSGQELYKNFIANQMASANLPYAQRMALAKTQQAEAQPNLTSAQANQANAQAGYLGSEQQINEYKRNNPAYINPDSYGMMLAANRMGLGNANQNPAQITYPNTNPTNTVPERLSQYFMTPAQKAAQTAEASQNVDIYNKEQQSTSSDSQSILKMIQDLDQFHQGYMGSTAKGGYLGEIPSHGLQTIAGNWNSEQQADRAGNKLVSDWQHEMGGRTTNMILNQIKSSKMDRSLNPEAELNQYNYLRSNLARALHANDFITAARSQGMPWEHALTSWKQFNEDMPAYDSSKQVSLPNADYSPYIGQGASNALSQGQRVNPSASNNIFTPPVISKGKNNMVTIEAPSGKRFSGTLKDAQRFLKDHPNHKIIG